jgi:hypothetical protein
MPESIREQILAAIKTALNAIAGTGGFQTNLVGKVFRDYQAALQVDEDLAVIILDRGDAQRRHARLVYENVMTVELRLVANEADPAKLNQLIARLLADIGVKVAATETWGGLAVRTFITEIRTNMSEAASPTGVAIAALEIWYRVSLTDPYTAGSI